jgi:hypothetical protein
MADALPDDDDERDDFLEDEEDSWELRFDDGEEDDDDADGNSIARVCSWLYCTKCVPSRQLDQSEWH